MENATQITSEPGSFKDPIGGVFYYKDQVFRWIGDDTGRFYQNLVESSFFQELIRSELFIPTSRFDLSKDDNVVNTYGPHAVYFKHEKIEQISFPYEWPISMIVDAALHTLNLQQILLKENLSLKDATPFNLQYRHTKPVFIDLGSLEPASKNGIWIAYNQFCQLFLFPILVHKFGKKNFKSIYITSLDGLTIEETVQDLGLSPSWKCRLILDYLIPALIVKTQSLKKVVTKKTISTKRTFANSIDIQQHTVTRLQKAIKRMKFGSDDTLWYKYTTTCLYSDENYRRKMEFVETCLESMQAKSVIDLGCNTGDFSIMAAKKGCDVVALDSDAKCVNHLYRLSKDNLYPILPLCINLTNPSPSIGWFNRERLSFLDRNRNRFECVLALALIHHLLVTGRVPLTEIARLFRHYSSKFLVVEYIGLNDRMFQELIKYRTESYDHYSKKNFEEAFLKFFKIHRKHNMEEPERQMDRCLYLMECHL